MRRDRRPDPASAPPASDEPALLRPRGVHPQPPQGERNERGYQETPITPATTEANREAEGNCALLHRARKSTDDSCAPAETSPGSPSPHADQRGPRRTRRTTDGG